MYSSEIVGNSSIYLTKDLTVFPLLPYKFILNYGKQYNMSDKNYNYFLIDALLSKIALQHNYHLLILNSTTILISLANSTWSKTALAIRSSSRSLHSKTWCLS